MKKDYSKVNSFCREEEKRLLSILQEKEYDKEVKNLIILQNFFEEYNRTVIPPPVLKDDITETTFMYKIRYMNIFKEAYQVGAYFNAISAIEDFSRFSLTIFEPSARGMLLAAWKMVNK